MTHPSNSAVQGRAEAMIVKRLGDEFAVEMISGGRIDVGEGAHVQVDARTEDGSVLVEAYARQGPLRGAQLKKVSQDILKFALLRQTDEWSQSRMVLAFASDEARDSIRGWAARAAHTFGVELVAVSISKELADQISAAQRRQVMVNLSPDEADAITDY